VTWSRFELGSADWDALLANVDVVHHYAWTSIPASANANPPGDLIANVLPLLAMLEALLRRGGGRVVFTSSGGTVYGRLHRVPVSEDHPIVPITAYGAGKAAAELYLNLYRALHGLDCRIARVANPYGAGQDLSRGQGAVTTFLHHALNGQTITIWGDGTVIRDYVHISDVAQALVMLATKTTPATHIFNIGSGVGLSLNDIIVELEAQIQCKLTVMRTQGRPFDVPVSVLALDRATKSLGWTPRLSFGEGIRRTLIDLTNQTTFSTLD
jgi:UDP-glucose 4-epimerase